MNAISIHNIIKANKTGIFYTLKKYKEPRIYDDICCVRPREVEKTGQGPHGESPLCFT